MTMLTDDDMKPARCFAAMSAEAKKYHELKLAYKEEVKTIRKQYITEVQQKLEEEMARKQ